MCIRDSLSLSAKGGIHVAKGSISWVATHGPNHPFRQVMADFAKQDVERNVIGKITPQQLLPPLPTMPELMNMHPSVSVADIVPEKVGAVPTRKIVKRVVGVPERLVNPSSGASHAGSQFPPSMFTHENLLYLEKTGVAPDSRLGFMRQARNADVAVNNLTTQNVDTVMAYFRGCLLYTSPSPRDRTRSRMPSSA